jgi:hypothetical protein
MTSTTDEPQVIEVDEVVTAVVTGVIDVGEMPAFFDRAFSTLGVVDRGAGADAGRARLGGLRHRASTGHGSRRLRTELVWPVA